MHRAGTMRPAQVGLEAAFNWGDCVLKLSDGEKLILLMLADISKKVGAGREIDPDFISHTLFHDQTWGFGWQFSGIPFDKQADPPEVTETVDILDMFSLTISQFQQLPPADQVKLKADLGYAASGLDQFPGFDGNHDAHYGVAQYLVEHLKRFTSLPGATNNSHSQSSLPRYREMLKVYLPMRPKLGLDKFASDDILAIFKAGRSA